VAIPLAVIEALPLVREAACSSTGRRAIKRATEFTCGPPQKGFVARWSQRFLQHGAIGGPLVPIACKLGGPSAVEPMLDVLCNTPPAELTEKFQRFEEKAQKAKAAGRALVGKPPKRLAASFADFYGG